MTYKFNTSRKLINICLGLCAFFCTSPVLALIIGGKTLSFYNIFLFASFFLMIINSFRMRKIILSRNTEGNILLLWLCLAALSCAFGLLYYYDEELWFSNSLSYLFKTFIYIIFVILVFTNCNDAIAILKGLELGTVVNLIWVAIDAIYFYIFKDSLTNKIFSSYIVANDVRYGSIDTFDGGLIRPAGFNTDPASIGLFAPFILLAGLLKKKIWMIGLAALSVVFSGSTTSLVCCMFAFAIYLVFFFKIKSQSRYSFKAIISITLILVAMIFFGCRYYDVIFSRVSQITERVNYVYRSGDIENVRVTYVNQLPKAILNQNIKFVTGTGFNTSSEGYLFENIKSVELRGKDNIPYDVENLYINYLMDNGIVGFIIFVFMLVRMYKKTKFLAKEYYREDAVLAFSALIAMISSSVFYHFTLYSFHILLWSAICVIPSIKEKMKKK